LSSARNNYSSVGGSVLAPEVLDKTGQQLQTSFVQCFELLIKSFNTQVLDLRAIVVANCLAGSSVEALVLEWRRQSAR